MILACRWEMDGYVPPLSEISNSVQIRRVMNSPWVPKDATNYYNEANPRSRNWLLALTVMLSRRLVTSQSHTCLCTHYWETWRFSGTIPLFAYWTCLQNNSLPPLKGIAAWYLCRLAIQGDTPDALGTRQVESYGPTDELKVPPNSLPFFKICKKKTNNSANKWKLNNHLCKNYLSRSSQEL